MECSGFFAQHLLESQGQKWGWGVQVGQDLETWAEAGTLKWTGLGGELGGLTLRQAFPRSALNKAQRFLFFFF